MHSGRQCNPVKRRACANKKEGKLPDSLSGPGVTSKKVTCAVKNQIRNLYRSNIHPTGGHARFPCLSHGEEEEDHPIADQYYHDTRIEIGGEEQSTRVFPKSGSWAEEVEKTDVQSRAKEIWSKFNTNLVPTPPCRLKYIEPIRVGANPPFKVFEGFVKIIWGNFGVEKTWCSDHGPRKLTLPEWTSVANCNKEKKVIWRKKQGAEKEKVMDNQKADIIQDKEPGEMVDPRTVAIDSRPTEVNIISEDNQLLHCKVKFYGQKRSFSVTAMVKPFHYGNHWSLYSGFDQTVMESWNKPVARIGVDGMVQKMFKLKHELKIFNRNNVGDVAMEYKVAKERQQSKIKWINFNDENSSYFHMAMRKRRMENRITTFMKGDTVFDNFEEVVKHSVKHIETFMGSKSNASGSIDVNCIKEGKCLNLEQQVNLIRPFNKGGVKKALFSIHPSKSPRLDGFGSSFFRDIWSKIGDEVSNAVLGFFTNG
uniref:Uncharacterized protein n=1 Tax=Cannabis sativa TaxID=3483 RepID=A0A803PCV9_CANSA